MFSDCRGFTRRDFLKVTAAATCGIAFGGTATYWINRLKQPEAGVAIYKADTYEADLVDLIRRGLENYPKVIGAAKGGRVVLKPNMVEYVEAKRVNTHPAVVAAAIEVFRSIGAREVIVAEGPGHRRDTELLLDRSGIGEAVALARVPFVDLNLDSIRPVPLVGNYSKLGRLFLPETVLAADLLVSMPKLKTHHWAGATLSMKNMFGTVPGTKYGWPKNTLHWHGLQESIVDVTLAARPGFAIIDGIEGMEGDGPIHGDTVRSGVIVMGNNPAAVDATAMRVMGLYPERIPYLQMMLKHGGTISAARIRQFGEPIAAVQQDFSVLEWFSILKKPSYFNRLIMGS
ncbi:MAG: DUF362 domain-containing protein [bacterium]